MILVNVKSDRCAFLLTTFIMSFVYCVQGNGVREKEQNHFTTQDKNASFSLVGGVTDVSFPSSEEILKKLAQAKTFEETLTLYNKDDPHLKNRAVSNATVTLRSRSRQSFVQTTKTDSQGMYVFDGLTDDYYEVSSEIPVVIAGQQRTAKARVPFTLSTRRCVWLNLRTDLVTVQGKVLDLAGQPVAGVKVRGNPDFGDVATSEWSVQYPTRYAVSEADGSYELTDLVPLKFASVAHYLLGYDATEQGQVPLCVRLYVEGYPSILSYEAVTKVPLVTEENLQYARQYLVIMKKLETSIKGHSTKVEKKDIYLPKSKGNVITGVDIVLKKSKTPAE